jgi:hypothetical protein
MGASVCIGAGALALPFEELYDYFTVTVAFISGWNVQL